MMLRLNEIPDEVACKVFYRLPCLNEFPELSDATAGHSLCFGEQEVLLCYFQ